MSVDNARFLDLTKGYMPIAIVIALAALLFQAGVMYTQLTGGTNTAQVELGKMQSEVAKIQQALATISQQVAALQAKQPDRTAFISKTDMYRFCLEAERTNKGFRCPQTIGED